MTFMNKAEYIKKPDNKNAVRPVNEKSGQYPDLMFTLPAVSSSS